MIESTSTMNRELASSVYRAIGKVPLKRFIRREIEIIFRWCVNDTDYSTFISSLLNYFCSCPTTRTFDIPLAIFLIVLSPYRDRGFCFSTIEVSIEIIFFLRCFYETRCTFCKFALNAHFSFVLFAYFLSLYISHFLYMCVGNIQRALWGYVSDDGIGRTLISEDTAFNDSIDDKTPRSSLSETILSGPIQQYIVFD